MKILVRLPNWLGDIVMSTAFLRALRAEYPGAEIDVIVKKGLESLTNHIPGIGHQYVFSRAEWKGLRGAWRFGRRIRNRQEYDLFLCLPDSISSACMARATGAKERVGFRKELRSVFLTRSFRKPASLHRVDEYVSLLSQYLGKDLLPAQVELHAVEKGSSKRVILNFNSEAVSRRLPVEKSVSLLNDLTKELPGFEFVCIGSAADKSHIESILQAMPGGGIINKAGETKDLSELIRLIATGSAMLTTDSGPAHVANALGLPVVVLFGAGNENNTAPYNREHRTILRLGQLPCEPCVKNTCIYGLPKCLELLDNELVVQSVKNALRSNPGL